MGAPDKIHQQVGELRHITNQHQGPSHYQEHIDGYHHQGSVGGHMPLPHHNVSVSGYSGQRLIFPDPIVRVGEPGRVSSPMRVPGHLDMN